MVSPTARAAASASSASFRSTASTRSAWCSAGRVLRIATIWSLLIDGERVEVFNVDGRGRGRGRGNGGPAPASATLALIEQAPPEHQVKRFVPAGHHTVVATFIKKTSAAAEDVLRPFSRSGQANAPAQPTLASVTISGPVAASGAGDTASRRRIFTCHPNHGDQESVCAKQIVTALAKQAYRRPVGGDDLETLLPFYEAGRAEGGFDAGIQRALERILVSPYFLFRAERDPARAPRPHQRPRARVPSLVLPVEQPAGRCAGRRRSAQCVERAGGARAAGQADAGRSPRQRARR